jgi:hypothetical protein
LQADDDVPSFQQLVEHAEALQHDFEQAEHHRQANDDLVLVHVRRRPATELAGACAALAAVVLDYRAALTGAELVVLPEPDDSVYARIYPTDGSVIELRLPPGDRSS